MISIKAIGIDLGTSNSVVSIMEDNQPVVIANDIGSRTTPSIVNCDKSDGSFIIGEKAKRKRIIDIDNTISSIKRSMGQRTKIKIGEFDLSPEEISSKILQKLKEDAETYLGEEVTKAVITVPAYFDNDQREATKTAGEIAGLEVLRIINEPTAASLAYGLGKKDGETILVYDLGGGTFDVTILEFGDGLFEVKSTSGDTKLGGDDFDQIVFEYLFDLLPDDVQEYSKKDPAIIARISIAAEKAKIDLSSSKVAEIIEPYLAPGDNGPFSFQHSITRAKFESLIEKTIDKTKVSVDNALKDAGLKPKDIDEVIFVGGSTRIPMVYDKVKSWLGKEPKKGVNPDEVVSMGAAIMGSVLTGDVKDIVLLDVTPLSLCIETKGGVSTRMIERNTTIPVSRSEVFSTAEDGQTMVDIHVVQGERSFVVDNKSLGRFKLTDIPPAPRGIPQIEVTFDIDADGILSVQAKDKATNKEQKIRIEGGSNLSSEEISKILESAEKEKEKDAKKKARIELNNLAEQEIYSAESMLKNNKEQLENLFDEEEPFNKKIEDAIQTVKQNLDSENTDILNQSIEYLRKTMMQAGQKIYENCDDKNNETNEKDF